ncbi:MAG: DUF1566 domain-containing protein, partial [Candidatus Euphemobacter frigidus]|nr:DUF1566 domain-containing protein [Candidatus Euphemobacter frigidus]
QKGSEDMKRGAMVLVAVLGLSLGLVCPAADFDGDGIGDIAIFRENSGLWAVRGVTRVYFGGTGDSVVPGDYSGGSPDQIAIFRKASGLWAVRGVTRMYFGGSSDTAMPGDYNGDGKFDAGIFRASSGLWAARGVTRVYFGGSADTAIPPGRAAGGLPQTGQMTSYDIGDDGYYQAGAAFSYHTEVNSGDLVTIDHNTGLMWASDGDEEGCNWGDQTDWYSAIEWANNLTFAGYDDWRLPNAKELQSIVDYGTAVPSIDTTYFVNTKSDSYWSSTTGDSGFSGAWVVRFNYGFVVDDNKISNCYVCAVRGGE